MRHGFALRQSFIIQPQIERMTRCFGLSKRLWRMREFSVRSGAMQVYKLLLSEN